MYVMFIASEVAGTRACSSSHRSKYRCIFFADAKAYRSRSLCKCTTFSVPGAWEAVKVRGPAQKPYRACLHACTVCITFKHMSVCFNTSLIAWNDVVKYRTLRLLWYLSAPHRFASGYVLVSARPHPHCLHACAAVVVVVDEQVKKQKYCRLF